MACVVLIPGAGGAAWYWHRTLAGFAARGHEPIAVDIREDDPSLGLPDYADAVEAAVAGRRDVVLVGQSMGAFTVPMVAPRLDVQAIVLVNPMIPVPGETPGQWWGATGQPAARVANDEHAGRSTEFTIDTHFLHDVPPDVAAAGADEQRVPADTPFGQPCEFDAWPDVPIQVIAGRDDRLFPLEFQRRVTRERLGLDVDEIDGGHLVALSNPAELLARICDYLGSSLKE